MNRRTLLASALTALTLMLPQGASAEIKDRTLRFAFVNNVGHPQEMGAAKFKELIAMVIGVVQGCDGCIASHARGAARAGATKQEAAEVIGVGIMMHGGPATIYGARAYAAFCEFADAGTGQPA